MKHSISVEVKLKVVQPTSACLTSAMRRLNSEFHVECESLSTFHIAWLCHKKLIFFVSAVVSELLLLRAHGNQGHYNAINIVATVLSNMVSERSEFYFSNFTLSYNLILCCPGRWSHNTVFQERYEKHLQVIGC